LLLFGEFKSVTGAGEDKSQENLLTSAIDTPIRFITHQSPAAISAVAYGRPYSVCTETALNLYRLAAGDVETHSATQSNKYVII
jgi:hypothetical protein